MLFLRGVVGTIDELFRYLWQAKLWWIMPMVLVLILCAVFIVLGSTTGVGPFIYTLF